MVVQPVKINPPTNTITNETTHSLFIIALILRQSFTGSSTERSGQAFILWY